MTTIRCKKCKLDINPHDKECGYFQENNKIYCEKCYANKRFKEVEDKSKWLEDTQNLINTNTKVHILMRKIPTEWESLITNQEKVKKIKDKWLKLYPNYG